MTFGREAMIPNASTMLVHNLAAMGVQSRIGPQVIVPRGLAEGIFA